MDKIHKDVLAKMTYKIMGRISNPRMFSEYLREIFSTSDIEEIGAKENQKGPTSGTQTMLSILEKRGPKAYGLFISVLRHHDIKLSDLADELEEEERKLRGKTGSVKLPDKIATGTDEEPMDDEHREILKRCKGTLVKDMEPREVLLHIGDPLLITTDEENQIMSRVTRQLQCDALLDMLLRKGAEAYDIFKETIAIVHPHLTRTIIEAENTILRSKLRIERAKSADLRRRLKHRTVKDGNPTDDELEKLSSDIAGIWAKLGRRLDVSDAKLKEIDRAHEPLSEKGYYTLKHWKHNNGAVKQGTPTDDELEMLGMDIEDIWKKLGRRLEVSDAKLTEIDKAHELLSEKAYYTLKHWKQSKGAASSYQALCDALQDKLIQRRDLADKWCYFKVMDTETERLAMWLHEPRPIRVIHLGKSDFQKVDSVEKLDNGTRLPAVGSVEASTQIQAEHLESQKVYMYAVKPPLEIIARGPLTIQAYQKALADGNTSVKRLPIMLIGQSGSGKTSLKRSLKGERFNPEETSTTGIELDPSYCKVTTEVWKVGEKTQATESDPGPISYEHSTAQYIVRNLKKEPKEPESSQLDDNHVTLDDTVPLTSVEDYLKNSSDISDALLSRNNKVSVDVNGPDLPDVSQVPEVPQEIAALIHKLLQVVEDGKDVEEEIYSVLWDFGGQFVYYATHPLFLTRRAIYCLVYNLSRDPAESAGPQVRHGFYKNIEDVFCDKRNRDYLDVWMSSISSLVLQDEDPEEIAASEMLPETLPPVFLVCTHADKPYKDAQPDELAREIFGSLQTQSYGKHLLDVFVVDNTKSGSEPDCPEVTRLKKQVLNVAKELPQMKELIPIKWLKYEKALGAMLGDGYKWISLDQARKIALDVCGIYSDEQFEALLNFLHDQRILIHFGDTPELNEMVILDLQWLIDVFKKIITVTPYKSNERKFAKLWLKLETTGILDEKLLEHVWGPLFDNRNTCSSLIALMEKFCLLCPWSPLGKGKSSREYLVPSMLMFPPEEDVAKLIASAGIPSLFVKFKSGQVPLGLFARLVLMTFQWCTKEFFCQSEPQLHHNFARFYSHPAEGCSVILRCHSSFIEVAVHKEDSTSRVSAMVSPEMHLSPESSFDTFQVNVARIVCRQLGLMLECLRAGFHWLKNMAYEMSVCCPVCCRQGSVNYCRNHKIRGCKQEECLHFWSESELRQCKGPITCTKSAVAGDYRVPLKLFEPWFKFADEQRAVDRHDGKALSWKTDDSEQALALPSGVLEALQLQTCDANDVVARLEESLSLEQASLEQPDPKIKRQVRCLCMKAKNANRLDVVKRLREVAPAGTTGPLLPEALDVAIIPFRQRQELTINLCGRDEWKHFAEKLGLNPAEILYLDKRVLNPCDAAVAYSRNQGHISCVGDLYDALVECDLPVMADLL